MGTIATVSSVKLVFNAEVLIILISCVVVMGTADTCVIVGDTA